MTTELEFEGTLELSNIDADWDFSTQRPSKWQVNPRISSIEFHPGAANDLLVVRHGSVGGVRRFFSNYADSQSDSRIKYFHGSRVIPYIKFSECVFSSGHLVIIELWRDS
jgi:hypothetical protein